MSSGKKASPSTATGKEPQSKKAKTLLHDGNRASKYSVVNQPGRVPLNKMSWHSLNRGGQQILPFHAHVIAKDICKNGTSARRYVSVALVEVPEAHRESWLAANQKKATLNPLLADFAAMSHTGPLYACLKCTHFVEGHKLILEGNRKFKDLADGSRFKLIHDDEEGRLIQQHGVLATVYSAAMWSDKAAILAIMRKDNLDAEIAEGETDLDVRTCFL